MTASQRFETIQNLLFIGENCGNCGQCSCHAPSVASHWLAHATRAHWLPESESNPSPSQVTESLVSGLFLTCKMIFRHLGFEREFCSPSSCAFQQSITSVEHWMIDVGNRWLRKFERFFSQKRINKWQWDNAIHASFLTFIRDERRFAKLMGLLYVWWKVLQSSITGASSAWSMLQIIIPNHRLCHCDSNKKRVSKARHKESRTNALTVSHLPNEWKPRRLRKRL